jgi:DNA-binding PadR family transcriptional regulator
MAKRRKVSNLLALTLLSQLIERPMYPYEMAAVLRERGKDNAIKINWGSLYTVVRNLEKHGFIEAVQVAREGRQPERTTYQITDTGRAEARDWVRELLGTPEREYTSFEAALGEGGLLAPDEMAGLLRQRLAALAASIAAEEKSLATVAQHVPRLFLIESEYYLAMRRAEAEWVRGLLAEIEDGTLPGVADWRRFHETGEVTPEMQALLDGKPSDG